MNRLRRRTLRLFRPLICFGNRNLNVDSRDTGRGSGWLCTAPTKKGFRTNDWIMVEVDSVNRYLAGGFIGIGSISRPSCLG